jgi:hypothetical protein
MKKGDLVVVAILGGRFLEPSEQRAGVVIDVYKESSTGLEVADVLVSGMIASIPTQWVGVIGEAR